MCLDLRWWAFRRKARKDIVCYKYLEKDNWSVYGQELLRTPARNFIVTIGETYTSAIDRTWNRYQHRWIIEKGIHSLVLLKDVTNMQYIRGPRIIIVKCVIPKGSYYYKGSWEFGGKKMKSYASTALKYIEIIPKI